jgi:uncharacterized protein
LQAYVDSCIVIYVVEQGFDLPSLDDADSLAVSDLVLLECLVGPLAATDKRAETNVRRFLERCLNLPLGNAVFERAARLRAEHRLKTPDAIHLAAAIEHGCDEFWTNDRRLAEPAKDSLAIRVLP